MTSYTSGGAGQQFTATANFTDNGTENLPGQVSWSSGNTSIASFSSSTAGFACWGTAGNATLTVTDGALSGSSTVTVVAPTWDVSNLLGNWEAQFANGYAPYASANPTWFDLTCHGFNGTLSSTSHASWVGSGTGSSPYALSLDGQGYVDFGSL